jgi:hypothetical protein
MGAGISGKYAPEPVAKEAPPTRQAMARALSASGALGESAGLAKKNFFRRPGGRGGGRGGGGGPAPFDRYFDLRSATIVLDDRYRFLYVNSTERAFGRASRAVRVSAEDMATAPSRLVDIHAVNKPKHDVCAHLREIAVLRKLEHQNIIEHSEFLHNGTSGVLYVITPQLERTLEDAVLDSGGLGFAPLRANALFWQLLEGIGFLHARNIRHRNLGPKGIFLDVVGDRVIIADFALSFSWIEEEKLAHKESRGLKRKVLQERLGKHVRLPYMAPEVVKSWLVSSSSTSFDHIDLWSLGALLVFLHKGRGPFGAAHDTPPAKLMKRILKSPPDLFGLEPHPCAILAKGFLRKKPAQRISIEDAMLRLRSNEGTEERQSTSVAQYVVAVDEDTRTTPEEDVAAVKPVAGPIAGAPSAKKRSDAALHVGRVARGSVARMRIQQWQQDGAAIQDEMPTAEDHTGKHEEPSPYVASPPSASGDGDSDTDNATLTAAAGAAGSVKATTRLGRTASVPTMKLNRKKRPLLRLGTSDNDLVELIEGVQIVSPSKDELMQKVSNYHTVRVKLGNWEIDRETLKGSIDARVMIPELEKTWGAEVPREAMVAEFRGPLDQCHWLVRDHILVFSVDRSNKSATKDMTINELCEFKKCGITRFVILSSGAESPPRYSQANVTKVWKSQRLGRKRSGSGDESALEMHGKASVQPNPRVLSPLSSPQALKRANSFGKQHRFSLMSPKKSFTVPTLQLSLLRADNDYRRAVDSVLESLILGEVLVLIFESDDSGIGLAETVSSMLLGRLYSFDADASVRWAHRLRETMGVEGGAAAAVVATTHTKADLARIGRILESTELD